MDYVHGTSNLLGAAEETETGSENKFYFHLDHLGTPRQITSEIGQEKALHSYYPLGQEATLPTKDAFQLKFTGHERDDNGLSGDLDYMHARYCSPDLGRFLSLDPVMQTGRAMGAPQLWNRYLYALNNPLNYTDPTGEDVSIQLTFIEDPGSEIWTEDMKQLIIKYIKEFWEGLGIGTAHVFDSAKGYESNFGTWVAGMKINASKNKGTDEYEIAAGFFFNFRNLSPGEELWAIANAINHELFNHRFVINREAAKRDLLYFQRPQSGPGTVEPFYRERFGTVADSYAFYDPRYRHSFISGPLPVHPDDKKLAIDKLGSIKLDPPGDSPRKWWKIW